MDNASQLPSRISPPLRPIPNFGQVRFPVPPTAETNNPLPQTRPAAGRTVRLVVIFLGITLTGLALLRYLPEIITGMHQPSSVAAAAPAQAATTIPLSEAEDLLRHLDGAVAGSLKASGEMKRSQDWVRRVLPSLEQHYLSMETRRLQAALAAAESARRQVEQAREELEIVKNLLTERTRTRP